MKKDSFSTKALVFWVMLLVVGTSVASDMFGRGDKTVFGKTIYVDDDNTDGPWDGTAEHPYRHIQDGVDNASDGDTVFVFGGKYHEQVIVDKSIALMGEHRNAIINFSENGSIVCVSADYVDISGFTVEGEHTSCVSLDNVENCIVLNNNINNNEFGIYLWHSKNNQISDNNIKNNKEGVVLESSKNNWISGNNIKNNIVGTYLFDSNSNILSNNTFITDGLAIYSSYQNIVKDNTVNGKPLVYFEEKSDIKIENAGQVILINCSNVEIENLDLSNTVVSVELCNTDDCVIKSNKIENNSRFGILLDSSNNNIISSNNIVNNQGDSIILCSSKNNEISHNDVTNNQRALRLLGHADKNMVTNNYIANNSYGIVLDFVENNVIIENTIEDNSDKGMHINFGSDNNQIYHNNFLNNTLQAYDLCENIWSHCESTGGNYWSDYTGEDIDQDGLGDTPYDIPGGNNRDNCPFMKPDGWYSLDLMPPVVDIVKPINALYFYNNKILPFFIPIIIGGIDVEIYASDDKSGVDHVSFYLDGMLKANLTSEPYKWTWNEKTPGRHTIKATAYDIAGNQATDEIIVWRFF